MNLSEVPRSRLLCLLNENRVQSSTLPAYREAVQQANLL